MSTLLLAFIYAVCAVLALWPGTFELNAALRGGLAALFAGRAVAGALLFVARRRSGAAEQDRILRSYLVLSYAYVTSGILVGAGALWYGGLRGFMVAYAAFSFVWVAWWLRGVLAKAREEQST
jgi:hypothetical protein